MDLKKGQTLELDIETLVQGGEGLARKDNFTIFVPQSVPKDKVLAEIISIKPNYARALIKKIIKPSDIRIEPDCPVTSTCGGCQWQEIKYKEQLFFKEKNLIESLNRIGNISLEEIEKAKTPIRASDNTFYYRNKAQFPFNLSNGKVKAGFYSERSHEIVEIDKCYIQNDKINQVFRRIKELVIKNKIQVTDEKRERGFLSHVIIRHSLFTDQILVGFVTKNSDIGWLDKIIDILITEFKEIKGIVQNVNEKKTNSILGAKNIIHYGDGYIFEHLKGIKYRISLNSFFQVNPLQTINMYEKVLEYCDIDVNAEKKNVILDAYSGPGSIALWLAKYSKKVIGIESSEFAVKDGIENAKINNIDNFEIILGTVEDKIPLAFKNNDIDIVVLDPPRKGCEPHIFDVISDKNVKKIIYISCNPSTLSRDAKIILELGYKLKKFQAFDMFSHTHHVETVALFEKE